MFQAMKLEKSLKISENIVFQKILVQYLKKANYSKKHSKTASIVCFFLHAILLIYSIYKIWSMGVKKIMNYFA